MIGSFLARLPLTDEGREHSLVGNLEGRAVLWPGLAVIVNSGRGDVGVTQPLLHLARTTFPTCSMFSMG